MKGKPFSRCFDLFTGLRISMTVAMAIWTALRATLWTNHMGYISLIARLPGIYGDVNKPCPRAAPSEEIFFDTGQNHFTRQISSGCPTWLTGVY